MVGTNTERRSPAEDRADRLGARPPAHGAHGRRRFPVRIDPRSRTVRLADKEARLSAREFELALAFFRHPGQTLSRRHLLSTVWGMDFDPGTNVVDVYVRYLRKKIGPQYFETVRGVGYRLVDSAL